MGGSMNGSAFGERWQMPLRPGWVDRRPSAFPAGLLRSGHSAFGQTRSCLIVIGGKTGHSWGVLYAPATSQLRLTEVRIQPTSWARAVIEIRGRSSATSVWRTPSEIKQDWIWWVSPSPAVTLSRKSQGILVSAHYGHSRNRFDEAGHGPAAGTPPAH